MKDADKKSDPRNPYLLVENAGYVGETILREGWDQEELRAWAAEQFSYEEIGKRKMAIARDGENGVRWYMRSLAANDAMMREWQRRK